MRVRIIRPTEPVEPVKRRVCAYARVSTDSFSQEESLENQVIYYEAMIRSNTEYEYVGVFADQGISGTTENRPEFRRMMEQARLRRIDLIITKSISRLARNTVIALETVRELKDIGVELYFEKENISTANGDGELMLTVLAAFAQQEAQNVSENTKWRIREKFERGELIINTKRFLGYDKDKDGNLVVNHEQAKVVRRIFEDFLGGMNPSRIAKALNVEGVPTVRGACWHDSTIREILQNEKYMGDARLQKYFKPDHLSKKRYTNSGEMDSYYLENNHEPIISREAWNRAQDILNARSASVDRTNCTNRYTMTGLLFCSKCGFPLIRRSWNANSPSRKVVWQCANYIRSGKAACTGTSIDDDIVSKQNIIYQTIVKESRSNGKKRYSYSRKSEPNQLSRRI